VNTTEQPHPKRRRPAEAGTEYADLPGLHITPNQVVAYNMAYWRRMAGLSQSDLADRLNRARGHQTWTNASVSAAERSWDGRRMRQFDADTILALATALGVPISAMFLPPEDDGVRRRYLMDLPDVTGTARCIDMRDLFELATQTGGFDWEIEDGDDAQLIKAVRYLNERYRQRLDAALHAYQVEGEVTYAGDAWGALGETDPRVLQEKLDRLRAHYEALRELLADISRVQDDLYEQLGTADQAALPEERPR